jgi:tetratricopeptide (TPR) repeat protein
MDRRTARVALGGASVAALLVAVALSGPLGRAWDDFKNDRAPAASAGTERLTTLGGTRYEVWSTAMDAFKGDPWRGIGPGTFEFYWSRHGDSPEFLRDAHSLYIEQAAELGIPGFLALLTAMGGLLAAAIQARMRWRRRREVAAGSAVIAAFVVFLVYAGVDWMWELGAIGTLAIGGVAVAGAGGLERAGERQPRGWLRLVLTIGALLIAAVQVPGLVSTQRMRESQGDLDRGEISAAIDAAGDAVAAEPWAASPYATRALAFERSGDLAAAVADADDAIDRSPDDFRNHLLIARLEAERGRDSVALAQLARARKLAPHNFLLLPTSPDVRAITALTGGGRSRGSAGT